MRWVVRVMAGLLALAAALAGWTAWEISRPRSTVAPDLARYGRPAVGTRGVRLPLTVTVAPVRKLALLEFTDDADPILAGLEPQVLERDGVTAFRVLAYRRDGGVDVYDDPSLPPDPDEDFQVIGTGQGRHARVPLGNSVFEVDAVGRLHLVLAFTDADGRRIDVAIHETTTRRSVPTNLLAPVGSSSQRPTSFPLFLMNDFEFIRLGGTQLDVVIAGRTVPLKPFPVPTPLQGQMRSFAKYTLDPEIISVFPTAPSGVATVSTDPGTDAHTDAHGVRYLFDGEALEGILVNDTEVVFDPPLDIATAGEGSITITSYPDLGTLAGPYAVAVNEETSRLTLHFDRVTPPHQRDPMYRLFVNERTVFGTWPLAYRYESVIDLATDTIDATWHNR